MQPQSQPLLWEKVSVCVPQTLTGPTINNGTNTPNNALGAGGLMTASTFTENTINANHNVRYTGVVVPINSKVRASVWIARGTGTNNRYVRMWVTDSGATYGFYTELDLQAGTAAIAVALGSGRVSGGTDSISITPVASGFNVTVTGIFSITLSGSPVVWMSSETAPNAFFYTGSGTQSFAYESVGLCVFS